MRKYLDAKDVQGSAGSQTGDSHRGYAICDKQGNVVPAERISQSESVIWIRRSGNVTGGERMDKATG